MNTVDFKHNAVLRLTSQGMPAWRAYKKVYGCLESTAKAQAYRVIHNTENSRMIQALDDLGVNEAFLAELHREGLNAVKAVINKDDKQEIIPDYQTRAKYQDMAYKLRGSYQAEKHVVATIDLNKEIADLNAQ